MRFKVLNIFTFDLFFILQEYTLQRSEKEAPETVRVKTYLAGNLDSVAIEMSHRFVTLSVCWPHYHYWLLGIVVETNGLPLTHYCAEVRPFVLNFEAGANISRKEKGKKLKRFSMTATRNAMMM